MAIKKLSYICFLCFYVYLIIQIQSFSLKLPSLSSSPSSSATELEASTSLYVQEVTLVQNYTRKICSEDTILDYLRNNKEHSFKRLLGWIEAHSDIKRMLSAYDRSMRPLSLNKLALFAPTDIAFETYHGPLDKMDMNPEKLKDMLLYHIVPKFGSDKLLEDGKIFPSHLYEPELNNHRQKLKVFKKSKDFNNKFQHPSSSSALNNSIVNASDEQLLDLVEDMFSYIFHADNKHPKPIKPMINPFFDTWTRVGHDFHQGNIIKSDICTKNGVINIIDSVLIPPSSLLETLFNVEKDSYSIFIAALEITGLAKILYPPSLLLKKTPSSQCLFRNINDMGSDHIYDPSLLQSSYFINRCPSSMKPPPFHHNCSFGINSLTVFAPSNEAFYELGEMPLYFLFHTMLGRLLLKKIMLYHLLPPHNGMLHSYSEPYYSEVLQNRYFNDPEQNPVYLPTLLPGFCVQISTRHIQFVPIAPSPIPNSQLEKNVKSLPFWITVNHNSVVIKQDILASNGVIHKINHVLLPFPLSPHLPNNEIDIL